jgi:uncharacterized membrane protein
MLQLDEGQIARTPGMRAIWPSSPMITEVMMAIENQEMAVEKETGRIEAFSDGVFAVAITLLVFNLKAPQLSAPLPGENPTLALGMALLKQWPSYLTFVTSFATILIMWTGHHSIFKLIYRSDTPFVFANGFLLLLVTVVPFPTSLVAQYLIGPYAAMACAAYAGIFVVINIAYYLLWWSAARDRHLLYPHVAPEVIKARTRNILFGPPVYLIATVLAFWYPYVSIGICSLLWIFWAFAFYERKPRRKADEQDKFL